MTNLISNIQTAIRKQFYCRVFTTLISFHIIISGCSYAIAQESDAYPVDLCVFSWTTLDMVSFNIMFKSGGTDVGLRFFGYQRDWFNGHKRLGIGTSVASVYMLSDPESRIRVLADEGYSAFTLFPVELSYFLFAKVKSFDAIDYWVEGNYYVWRKGETTKRQYISSLLRLKLMISAWGKTNGPEIYNGRDFEGNAKIFDFSLQGYFFTINNDPMPIPGGIGLNLGVRYIQSESEAFSRLFDSTVFYLSLDIGFNGGAPGHHWRPYMQ